MFLGEAVFIVARHIGIERARELLAERTPEEAMLDFWRWAMCPAIMWPSPRANYIPHNEE